jgi:hypothetical protein
VRYSIVEHGKPSTWHPESAISVSPGARPSDPTKAGLPAGGMLPWHQTEPGGEVSCALEHADVRDHRCDQGCGDRANSRDRGQAAGACIVPRVSDELRFERPDAFGQRVVVLEQSPDGLPRFLWEAFLRVHECHEFHEHPHALRNGQAELVATPPMTSASMVWCLTGRGRIEQGQDAL